MGPRRRAFALVLITLGLLLAWAGVAAASSDAPAGGPWSAGQRGDRTERVRDAGHGYGRDSQPGSRGFGLGDPPTHNWNNGHSGGATTNGGDDGTVEGSSVGTPPTPVEAPPATASGPAPDAVAAAPIPTSSAPVFAPAFVPEVGGGGGTDAGLAALVTTAVPEVAPAVVPEAAASAADEPASFSLADLPDLGTIGEVTATAGAGSSAAEALLSSGTGGPIAAVLALLAATLLFLSIHRRVDRGDAKLAAAHIGPDVARFR